MAELAAAGVACSVADGLFHPLDTLKTRQHAGVAKQTRGLADLWTSGLAATAARALTFAATRVGAYPSVRDALSSDASVSVRVAAGSLTGAFAAAVFTPLDILRLRSQLTPRAHPTLDVLGGLRKLAASEGFSALWRGASVNVARAAVLTSAQLASYDGVKRQLCDERNWREDDSLNVTTRGRQERSRRRSFSHSAPRERGYSSDSGPRADPSGGATPPDSLARGPSSRSP